MRNRFGGYHYRVMYTIRRVVDMRETADFAVIHSGSLYLIQRSPRPRTRIDFSVAEYHVQPHSGFRIDGANLL